VIKQDYFTTTVPACKIDDYTFNDMTTANKILAVSSGCISLDATPLACGTFEFPLNEARITGSATHPPIVFKVTATALGGTTKSTYE